MKQIILVFLFLVQGCQKSSLSSLELPPSSVVAMEQKGESVTVDATHQGISLLPTETYVDPDLLFFSENVAGFQMIETPAPSNIPEYVTIKPEDTSVINSSEDLRAYWICINFCDIFVEELETGKTYEISAPSILPGRPFSDLEWSDMYILEFNQSTQPNHIVHYIVDVENHLLLNVYPIQPEP